MYLSKKHKLLFIAVPRTASNSVQEAIKSSGIADPTDVVYSLSPDHPDHIDNYHMRPTTLVENGLITDEGLSEYTAFGFVREPLERWVSSIFLARSMGMVRQDIDPLDLIVNLVNSGVPRPFAGKDSKFSQPNYKPFHYRNFFFHGDKQVVDAYRWEDFEAVTNRILSEKLGSEYKGTFPHINMNPDGTPDEFKAPVESWLPSDCYEKMKAYFAEETAFYESVDFFSE